MPRTEVLIGRGRMESVPLGVRHNRKYICYTEVSMSNGFKARHLVITPVTFATTNHLFLYPKQAFPVLEATRLALSVRFCRTNVLRD